MPISKSVRSKGGKGLATKDGMDRSSYTVICCTPKECLHANQKIEVDAPGDAVRVICNNESCTYGNWMHGSCFDEWEDIVLAYLRSCGRARSWSEKQRMQNLWTKKGYDLAFKACDCRCTKGHLRKDLDYSPPLPSIAEQDERKNRRGKKRVEKISLGLAMPSSINGSSRGQAIIGGNGPRAGHPSLHILRPRTQSLSSTGSSPPPSSSPGSSSSHSDESVIAARDHHHHGGPGAVQRGTTGPAPGSAPAVQGKKFEFFADKQQAAAGNIFRHREDLKAFSRLPQVKRNSYHIKVEDEGPYGNDETRCFVLSTLSSHKATSVPCVICGGNLTIYDRYPLVDGTFFVSPQQYNGEITVGTAGAGLTPPSLANQLRPQYLNAVCMCCLEGDTEIRCRSCDKPWDGRILQLGTMYSYDIFAAAPCCRARLQCKGCGNDAADMNSPALSFFSAYSRPSACVHCQRVSCHFVKPLKDVYYPSASKAPGTVAAVVRSRNA